jgi:hypothetical protein
MLGKLNPLRFNWRRKPPQQTPTGGLTDGQFLPVRIGGLGASATNKQRRVYTDALLAFNVFSYIAN